MTRTQLVEKARAAGFELRGPILGKFSKRGRVLLGVRMWEDGSYTRADVENHLATKISGHSAAARALGLK